MLSPVRPPSILQAHQTSLGGSTLELDDFFKKDEDQDLDILRMFYKKLTLYSSDQLQSFTQQQCS